MIVSRSSAEKIIGRSLDGLGRGIRSYYAISNDCESVIGGPLTKDEACDLLLDSDDLRENPTPADTLLYSQVTGEAKRKFDVWPSVYASSWVVREYKKRGGRYINPLEGLEKWYSEKWVDLGRSIDKRGRVKKWVQCGRPKAGAGAYPKCVPLKRAKQMSPKERLSAVRRKRVAESSSPKIKGRKPKMVKTAIENPGRRKLYIYPNKSSRDVARRALDRRKILPRSKRGGLDAIQAHEQGIGSGVMRARDIASGKRINAYQVKAFFDRHRHNYLKAKASGKKWEDSKALQAWDLWGGEPLRKQVEAAVRADKRKRAKSNPGSDKMPNEKMTRRRTVSRKPYTVYLVQDKPRGLILYSFKSDELICPSASASEYAWLLGESALKSSGTHIFTSDTKLKKFLRSSNKRILRGRPRYPNPRNSKVKDALAEEATNYTNFNEFANAYWNSCSRGLYWYATNERRFHIGLPEEKKIDKGTFTVACSPELALKGKNEGKKFVAELDVTRLPKGSIVVKRGSAGSQIKIVGSAGSIKIGRVLEASKAKRAFKWQLSILPSSKEGLRQIWEKAWAKRKRDAKKEEIRREKKAERELKRAEARAKEEAAAAKRQAKKARTKAEKARKGRIAAGKRASARKSSAARTRAAKAETARAKSSRPKAKGKKVVMGPADRVPNPSGTRSVRANVNKVSR